MPPGITILPVASMSRFASVRAERAGGRDGGDLLALDRDVAGGDSRGRDDAVTADDEIEH